MHKLWFVGLSGAKLVCVQYVVFWVFLRVGRPISFIYYRLPEIREKHVRLTVVSYLRSYVLEHSVVIFTVLVGRSQGETMIFSAP